jgi:SAM-dependent methyltransferase
VDKINLAKSYDIDAHRRVNSQTAEWKVIERQNFLHKLLPSDKKYLLEIGAGTGNDSKYFKDNGFEVTCIDLSGEMVRYCKEKGLNAQVMDFYNLEFKPNMFDAIYALNCLLHVPKNNIESVLLEIERVMKPKGLFFMGLYGGKDSEGIWENDWCDPKRFFASYSDTSIRTLVGQHFKEVYFNTIPLQPGQPHFQSLILEKK